MQQITIRKATLNDMETLLRFEQGVIEAERPFDVTLKNEHTYYYNINQLITAPHIELLVAEQAGQLVASGYARIETAKPYLQHEKYAYLGFMYVAPECRGQGINQLIVEGLKAWSRSKNVTELRLEVYDKNHGAIRAYEKTGFARHMILMRLDLNDD